MYRVTEVVKHLLIINILMFLGTAWLMGEPTYVYNAAGMPVMRDLGRLQLALFFPTSAYFAPYQVVTHMFMHANFQHLFFNMFALFLFGPPIESVWGPRRFLFFYFVTGLGAMFLHLFVKYLEVYHFGAPSFLLDVPMLGASGAVFGILTGYGMLFPNNRIMLLIPPIPMRAKYFVMVYAAIELFLGLGPFQTGVAHFAHLGGALFGFLLILYWRRYGSRL